MAKKKFYAVVVGRKPGIYDQWFGEDGAEIQVNGLENAVYKSFQSHAEAEIWYRERSKNKEIPSHLTEPVADDANDYFSIHQQAMADGHILIYTDGGCAGNPGKGSYGVVMLYKDRRKELSGGYQLTTNNRMELMGCIAALQSVKQQRPITIFSDSAYVIDAMQKGWAKRWKQQGWQRNDQKHGLQPVKNADLWQELLALCDQHDVRFIKVRGHAGSAENDRCHDLATQALQRDDLPQDQGYEAST